MTVPLQTVQAGPKALVKRVLNRPLGGYASNARRNHYKRPAAAPLHDREPILDLAALEAVSPDGRVTTFSYEGQQFAALAPANAADAGHLNERGRRIVAAEFLNLMAEVSARSDRTARQRTDTLKRY